MLPSSVYMTAKAFSGTGISCTVTVSAFFVTIGFSSTTGAFSGAETFATAVSGLTLGTAFIPNAVKISGISLSSCSTSESLLSSVISSVSDQLCSLNIPTTSLLVPFLIYMYMVQGANNPASGRAPSLSNIWYENFR